VATQPPPDGRMYWTLLCTSIVLYNKRLVREQVACLQAVVAAAAMPRTADQVLSEVCENCREGKPAVFASGSARM